MDFASLAGGATPPKEASPALEYTAQATSPLVNGEVRLVVGEDSLTATALFDAAEISYADMTALEMADYTVTVQTGGGSLALSRMGSWCGPFYDALCEAYNRKVQRALFVPGQPLLATKGCYRYEEGGVAATGAALVQVHENCVCVLPPNLAARRIPLCFLSAFGKQGQDVALELGTGERYVFSRLGYDGQPFADSIEKQLRAIRKGALEAVKAVDPSLGAAQASAVATLMPEGAAAPLGRLAAAAPTFADAVGRCIRESRIAESAGVFTRLCDPAQICVGIKRDFARTAAPNAANGPNGPLGKTGQNMLWMIVPGRKPGRAAVEFAGGGETAAATFLYRFDVPWEVFWRRLNYAMEAIGFRREVIRLTGEELQEAQHADNRMAVQRNTALQFVRGCYAGRAIHRTVDSWEREVAAHLSGEGV